MTPSCSEQLTSNQRIWNSITDETWREFRLCLLAPLGIFRFEAHHHLQHPLSLVFLLVNVSTTFLLQWFYWPKQLLHWKGGFEFTDNQHMAQGASDINNLHNSMCVCNLVSNLFLASNRQAKAQFWAFGPKHHIMLILILWREALCYYIDHVDHIIANPCFVPLALCLDLESVLELRLKPEQSHTLI